MAQTPRLKGLSTQTQGLVAMAGRRGNFTLPDEILKRIEDLKKAGAKPKDLAGWLEVMTKDGYELAAFWMSVMLSPDAPLKDRITAAREIRDTRYGKPTQTVDQSVTLNPNVLRTAALTDEQLLALEAPQEELPAYLVEAEIVPVDSEDLHAGQQEFETGEEDEEDEDEESDPEEEWADESES